jgi:hypothetical protein
VGVSGAGVCQVGNVLIGRCSRAHTHTHGGPVEAARGGLQSLRVAAAGARRPTEAGEGAGGSCGTTQANEGGRVHNQEAPAMPAGGGSRSRAGAGGAGGAGGGAIHPARQHHYRSVWNTH